MENLDETSLDLVNSFVAFADVAVVELVVDVVFAVVVEALLTMMTRTCVNDLHHCWSLVFVMAIVAILSIDAIGEIAVLVIVENVAVVAVVVMQLDFETLVEPTVAADMTIVVVD
jgi:uncharacterized membrane protein YoaK (UPF0700 family)